MARPKSTARSVLTTVRLPEALHHRLAQAGRGEMSSQIKGRLEATLALDEVDEDTADLISAIVEMASLIRDETGADWHARVGLRQALATAIDDWLAERVPEGHSKSELTLPKSPVWLRKGDTPAEAGANLFRLYKLVSDKKVAAGELSALKAIAFWNLKPSERKKALGNVTSDVDLGLGLGPHASQPKKSKGKK